MKQIKLQTIEVVGSVKGSLKLFESTLKYILNSVQDNYYTPDDRTFELNAYGELQRDRKIFIVIHLYPTPLKTHGKRSTIKLSYNNERSMTEFMECDILKILAQYGLRMLYTRKTHGLEVEVALK